MSVVAISLLPLPRPSAVARQDHRRSAVTDSSVISRFRLSDNAGSACGTVMTRCYAPVTETVVRPGTAVPDLAGQAPADRVGRAGTARCGESRAIPRNDSALL